MKFQVILFPKILINSKLPKQLTQMDRTINIRSIIIVSGTDFNYEVSDQIVQ